MLPSLVSTVCYRPDDGRAQGFGSVLHTATIHLGVAMQHGRVFLWLPARDRPIAEDRQWWKEHVHANDARLNDMVRRRAFHSGTARS